MSYTPHIIIADDDPTILWLMQRVIKRIVPHADITTVRDGQALLDADKHHAATLIISDHRMPQMSGLDALRALRTRGCAAPAILISGYLAGGHDVIGDTSIFFLKKPVDMDVLTETVQTLIV